MSLAGVSTVAVSLLILGIFIILGYYIQTFYRKGVEEKIEMKVFLNDDITTEQLNSLREYLYTFPEVEKVDFISKEQALKEFKETYKNNPEFINSIQGYPLPASYKVKFKNPEKIKTVADKIKTRPGIDEIKYGQSFLERLFKLRNYIILIGIILFALLCFASIILIANAIRMSIFSRRKEVAVMKLVGATNWFIRWPFAFEGIITGSLGAIISIILLLMAHLYISSTMRRSLPYLNFSVSQESIGLIFFLLFAMGVVIGIFGSFMALRRFLKV